MEGVVIIGGHIQGLGLARMLGCMDIPIIIMDTTQFNIARFSRYCKKFIRIPEDIFESEIKFCSFLKGKNNQYKLKDWLIFPSDDRTVAFLSQNKNELSNYYKIWTPAWNIVESCYNKKLTYIHAKKLKIPIPQSYFPKDLLEVKDLMNTIQYPVILKPAIMHSFYSKTGRKVIVVHHRGELEKQYQNMAKIIPASEIIIQEIIPGSSKNLYSCGSFFKDGSIIASIIGQRSRQIPMDFGKASTFVELTEIAELRFLSQKLLEELKYYGLSEVEFKYDSRDGKFKLLEINPRTWKWHSISLLNGLNFPYLLFCEVYGKDYEDHIKQLTNGKGKWIDIYTDIYVSMIEIFRGKMTFKQYIHSLSGKKIFSSLCIEDPFPFIAETLMIPILLYRR